MPNPSPLIQPYQNPTPTSINNPALSKPPGQPSMGGVPPSTLSHIPNIQPFSAPAPMGVGVGMGLPGGVTSADLLQQQSAPLMTQGYMPSTVPSLAPGPSVPIAPPSEPPKYNTRSAGKDSRKGTTSFL
jgi:hypothetical protein